MNWFSYDFVFDYFKNMDFIIVVIVVLVFDEKNIINMYDGIGFVIVRIS